jgi:SAM-dependent methyltransferase
MYLPAVTDMLSSSVMTSEPAMNPEPDVQREPASDPASGSPDDYGIALSAYEELAEAYSAMSDTKPHNAYYERPATLSLLPDVSGRRVLDVGSGPGVYARTMLERGAADVVGVELSPRMIEFARQRTGGRVQFHQADIARGLPFLMDETFDIVVAPLVIGYVRELRPVFQEFHRVLAPGGVLVFSDQHPFGDFSLFKELGQAKNYYAVEKVGYTWRGFGKPVHVPFYRKPLQEVVSALLEAGFILERLLEPKPTPEFQQGDPAGYAKLMVEPCFICYRARKPA